MTPALAELPDDPDRLPGWLEARIAGGGLRALAAELAAVHAAAPPAESVRQRLAPVLPTILTGGLSALPEPTRGEAVRHLLVQPHHLLELQEVVLTEGGPYWDAIEQPVELLLAAARVKSRVAGLVLVPAAEPSRGAAPARRREPWYRSTWAAVAATAALVCVATLAATHFLAPPGPAPVVASGPGWGWAKVGGIPADQRDRRKYLAALADRADEWFAERPDDAVGVARRLAEFREGCAVLLLAPHEPLAPAERDDLKKRCRNWAAKFDGLLARVEAGENPAAVRAEADAAVRKLVGTLRAEAQKS